VHFTFDEFVAKALSFRVPSVREDFGGSAWARFDESDSAVIYTKNVKYAL
jgi:hypothetical protein